MQSILWFLVWFAMFAGLTTASVPAADAPTPPPVSTPAPPTGEAALDEPFPLAYGSTAALDDGNLTVTFEGIVEDSRCPSDVMCAWSGQVIAALRIEAAGEDAQTVELGGITDSEGILDAQRPGLTITPTAAVGEYTVELLAATPYPAHAAEPPSKAEYTLSLVVRR